MFRFLFHSDYSINSFIYLNWLIFTFISFWFVTFWLIYFFKWSSHFLILTGCKVISIGKSWLLENNDDKRSFGCSVCNVHSLELGNMGKQALEEHMKTKKHGERLKNMSSAGPVSLMKVWAKSGSSGKTFFNEEYLYFFNLFILW